MISEYALDPVALKDWINFRILADGLGFSRGRVVVRYPKEWKKLAHEAIDGLSDTTKKYAVTWLIDRAPKVMVELRKGSHYDRSRSWFENAIDEHHRKRFRAIICNQPKSDEPPVLPSTEISRDEPLWAAPTQVVIARNAIEIAKHVAPLLAHARQIRIVDPYFMADPDQTEILLECITSGLHGRASEVESIEIHVDGEKVQAKTVAYIRGQLERKWPSSVPKPSIFRWQSGYLHNRFILTDVGGIYLGDSLREHAIRSDQITLLEEDPFKHWWTCHDPVARKSYLCP